MSREMMELRADALELVSGGMNVKIDHVESTLSNAGDTSILQTVLGQIVKSVMSQIHRRAPA